jgi:probable phosphoglycerate mutase
MIEVALVRHGETDWNRQGRMQGHRDIPLNETGIMQARRLAERMKSDRWNMVWSSDLARAAATADQVAQAAGIPFVLRDARLRERNFGRLEGTTLAERVNRWGPDWQKLNHGVESDRELFGRAEAFLGELARKGEGRFVVVTHGGWIREVFRRLFPEQAGVHPGNTAVSLLRLEEGAWRCLLAHDVSHLPTDA